MAAHSLLICIDTFIDVHNLLPNFDINFIELTLDITAAYTNNTNTDDGLFNFFHNICADIINNILKEDSDSVNFISYGLNKNSHVIFNRLQTILLNEYNIDQNIENLLNKMLLIYDTEFVILNKYGLIDNTDDLLL